jgi:hypothetical protein
MVGRPAVTSACRAAEGRRQGQDRPPSRLALAAFQLHHPLWMQAGTLGKLGLGQPRGLAQLPQFRAKG